MQAGSLLRVRRLFAALLIVFGIGFCRDLVGQGELKPLSHNVKQSVLKGEVVEEGYTSTDRHLHLALQLPLRNEEELRSLLADVYNPGSTNFRHFLSVDEFTARFAPTQADYEKVEAFAKNSGMRILSTSRNRMVVEVDSSVAQANVAFHITMKDYRHPTQNRTFFSPDRTPSIDAGLPLSHVAGLENYTPPFRKSLAKDGKSSLGRARVLLAAQAKTTAKDTAAYPPNPTGSGPYNSYIPSDFRAAYYGSGPLDGTGQSVGLLEFAGYDPNDIDLFYSTLGLKIPTTLNVVLTGGLTAPLGTGGDDGEPMGDIVFASSVAPHLDQIRIYECCSADYNGSTAGPAVLLNKMASENITKQISISWGWGSEVSQDESAYMEMAAQGQTVFEATGDYGSPQNPGNNTYDDYGPADDPWVTAVTMDLLTTKTPGGAWANEIYAGGSGGGYSDGPAPLPIPSWQVPVINSKNNGSTVYRNVPDVSADGFGMFLCGEGQCYPNANCLTCDNGGASFATPIWASLMALVNQEAKKQGKSSLGFINPQLYALGQSSRYSSDFHDVIGGNNGCCGQVVYYTAVPGYDLVSGWGAPAGPQLITDLINQGASFTLVTAANALSIGPSDSTATQISVQRSDRFSGAVKLSVSGLPAGVSASFDNSTATTTAVLTLRSGAKPATGTYDIVVTGVSGSDTSSTTIHLTITSKDGNFTIGGPATTFSMVAGASTATTLTVTTVDGLNGAIALSATGLPSGMKATFSPASINPGTNASATVNVTLASSPGTPNTETTPSFVGRYGSIVNTLPITVQVSAPYTVGTTAQGFSVGQGQSITIPVTVTSLNGFSSAVNMSVSGLPTGVTASFSPAALKPAANGNISTNLTLSAAKSVSIQTATISLVGSFGSDVVSSVATLAVTAPVARFTLTSPLASTLLVGVNSTASYPVKVMATGSTYSAAVTLSATGLPGGVTASFNPTLVYPNGGSATSVLTLAASTSANIAAVSTATLRGVAGGDSNFLSLPTEVSGSLKCSEATVSSSGSLGLTYTVAAQLANVSNAVGVIPEGQSPNYPYAVLTKLAPSTSGTLQVNVGGLTPGKYRAWLFYQESSLVLAGPALFTVTP